MQFAGQLGLRTVAITSGTARSPWPQLGAHHCIDDQTQDTAAALRALGRREVVLGTVASDPAMTGTLSRLTHRGELIVISVNPEPIRVSPFALIGGHKMYFHTSGTSHETRKPCPSRLSPASAP